MHTRSEFRHACYRAKNGVATEKNKQLLALIEPLLQVHQRWENFAEVWDVIITKDKTIKIIAPEKDRDFIHKALVKAALFNEMGKEFSELSDREYNIVTQVEQIMLDGVMTWQNYNETWGVVFDESTNVMKTVQYNVQSKQTKVTEEMIQASKKDADGSAFTQPSIPTTVLEAKPVDEAQKKVIEEFLKKNYKG